MKTTTETIDPIAAAERVLREAGLDFAVVDRCPRPDCEVCASVTRAAAA